MRKMMINKRIASIPSSATLGITSRAKHLAASGKSICNFAAGEPDFDTPQYIKDAAIQALGDGKTKYAPVAGLVELRAAIAEKLQRENGLHYEPEQIVVSNGAKHSLYNVFAALLEAGDEVIIPSPYWLSYPEMVRLAGGKPVFAECAEEQGFKVSPDGIASLVTERTKAVILNSPCNPTGVVYSREELAALADVAVSRGVYVISDEIYEKMVYDGVEHASIGSLSPEILEMTVTVNGFSKAFSMTGWRVGYFAGPEELARGVTAFQSHTASAANTFALYGALAALKGDGSVVDEMVNEFAHRRSCLVDRLCGMEGVRCVMPQGAFYAFPNVSSFGLDAASFAGRLLDSQGVAVVPGDPFGCEGHIRLSYACSMDEIQTGMDRFEKFLKAL